MSVGADADAPNRVEEDVPMLNDRAIKTAKPANKPVRLWDPGWRRSRFWCTPGAEDGAAESTPDEE
jgi:hypothetical protein